MRYSVIVTGLIRVVLGYAPGSQNVAFSKAELWSAVHIGIAIVCACLPTLRPTLNRFTAKAKSLYGSAFSSSKLGHTSGTSNQESGGSNNRGPLEVLTLKHVKKESKDPHRDTAPLTNESGELGSFIHNEFVGESTA